MSGTFRVTLGTPIGQQSGTITFTDENGALSGTIRAMGSTNRFTGRADGNAFEISGVLSVGFFRFRYTARGTVDGDTLTGKAYTDTGAFPMSGKRTA